MFSVYRCGTPIFIAIIWSWCSFHLSTLTSKAKDFGVGSDNHVDHGHRIDRLHNLHTRISMISSIGMFVPLIA